MNPYDIGFTRNCKEALCSRIPLSRNNFRETVRVDPLVTEPTDTQNRNPDVDKETRETEFEHISNHVISLQGVEGGNSNERDEKQKPEIGSSMSEV